MIGTLLEISKDIAEHNEINWTSIVVTLVGLVGAGGVVKLYAQYSLNKKHKLDKENELEKSFRDELKSQINSLVSELKIMDETLREVHESQLELIKENANLKAQLTVANKEILELKAEISILLKKK